MYPLGTWFVSGIRVWIPCIKETMMMMMMMMIIIIIIPSVPFPHSVEMFVFLQALITLERDGVVKYRPSSLIFKRPTRRCDSVYVKQVT
jgi:hypothetical protein